MTPKQLAILDFIRKYIEKHGYAPILQEIADKFVISKVTARDHLEALERRGVIRRQRYLSRSIEILDPTAKPAAGTECPCCGQTVGGAA